MSGFAPTADGALGTVRLTGGGSFGFSITGGDALHAEIFRQISGSSRFLVFRTQNIDEYTSAGVRTNRGTGYNASTADWHAATWGDQIIACNYLDATQSSTGAGFSGLGGGSPKARYVAANINFVMLADVDDGGSNVYSDMVWWSGVRNPNTWTPSQATQAGAVRLLDVPGPIRRLVAFGDKFVAFKDNGIFVGQYIGPPYVFSWKLVSAIGCTYPRSVVELDGRLYFVNYFGIYSFDGQQITDIGRDIRGSVGRDAYDASPLNIRGYADDLEGNYWLLSYNQTIGSFVQWDLYAHAINVRSRLKSRVGLVVSSSAAANNSPPPVVAGDAAERYAFNPLWGVRGGFVRLDNAASPRVDLTYIGGAPDGTAMFTTGVIGQNDATQAFTRVYIRGMSYSQSATAEISSATLTAYPAENTASVTSTGALSENKPQRVLDGVCSGKYKTVSVTLSGSSIQYLKGLGVATGAGEGRR